MQALIQMCKNKWQKCPYVHLCEYFCQDQAFRVLFHISTYRYIQNHITCKPFRGLPKRQSSQCPQSKRPTQSIRSPFQWLGSCLLAMQSVGSHHPYYMASGRCVGRLKEPHQKFCKSAKQKNYVRNREIMRESEKLCANRKIM